MKTLTSTVLIALIAASGAAFSEEKTSLPLHHSAQEKSAQLSIPAAAKDAVATVDRFTDALSAGKLDKAGAELDTNVLILESGDAEHSAAEYLGGHAKADAAFLKTMRMQLVRRTAQVNGDAAWVGSESELHGMKDGKMLTILGTETMVLKRTNKIWKITHIHWSSHTRKAGEAH